MLFSPPFFFQLQVEVQRLEDLKLQNLRNVTDAIRSEIAVFWEKCFFSTDQRQAFAPYFSGEFLRLIITLKQPNTYKWIGTRFRNHV